MQKRVRAIIIENNRLLAIKRTKPEGIFWVFTGGGIEEGETNEQSLLREAKEELGLNIHIRELFCEKESTVAKTLGQREYFYDYQNQKINIVLRSIEKLRKIASEEKDLFQKEVFRKAKVLADADGEVTDLLKEIEKI